MARLPFPPDTRLAERYRPVSVIASGGMGLVVEAIDEHLDRPVALKLVTTTAPDEVARLHGEARSLARVRHRNVIDVYDAGEQDGRPFIVTELVRGESLRDLLVRHGPLPLEQVASIGADVARALECAHRAGVVHRDLKPANILVESDAGQARLIDFGSASGDHVPALTRTGMVVGTPAYLAPEQVEGRRADPAVDVYALGLVLIEALSGQTAFPGTTTETVAARLVRSPPLPDGLDRRWEWLLAAMTRRDPDTRPASAAVASLLAAMVHADDAPPRRPEDDARRSSRRSSTRLVRAGTLIGMRSPGEPTRPAPRRRRRPARPGRRQRTLVAVTTASAATLAALGALSDTEDGAERVAGTPPSAARPAPAVADAAPSAAVTSGG